MNKELLTKLEYIKQQLKICNYYRNAIAVLGFDFETICPKDAMEDEGNTIDFLDNEVFKIKQNEQFTNAYESLFENLNELDDEYDKVLITSLHKEHIRIKNITPEFNLYMNNLTHKAHLDWLKAKEQKDYSLFKDSLAKIRDAELELFKNSEVKYDTPYDYLLDKMEPGVTSKDLDDFFSKLRDGTIKILNKVKSSKEKIDDSFLFRPVSIAKQEAFSQKLMKLIGFDTNKGMLGTTEHPFTNSLAKNDARITTHYYENNFISNIFTIIHEGGHAIFYQNQNEKDFSYFLDDHMTDSMHESVSRFYENRIARSKPFIKLIYPMLCEEFSDVMQGVSETQLYKAINKVSFDNPTRTEADELTYALHIIIRYELEKDIMNNNLDLDKLPLYWNQKYKDYLGVIVKNDTEGVLQDIHWTEGFAYFPAYALGNAINAMYYNKMSQELDIEQCILNKDFASINHWMKENVFKKANILDPKPWLYDIVKKDLDPNEFLTYLNDKYQDIYNY